MLEFDGARIVNGGFTLSADFTVRPGRRVAVMGPSGAGKSTLLGGIAGFLPLEAGRIAWEGRDLTDAAPGNRPVAMLFQDGNLFPHLDIETNVALGVRPDLKLTDEQRAQVDAALERVGLAGLGARKPAALSGGQQSRAALARILVQHRPLVLLDEPFSALGPALRREMLDLVDDLAGETGATLLMITHDPADAVRIADDIVLVVEGRAYPPTAARELLEDPPEALRAYLG